MKLFTAIAALSLFAAPVQAGSHSFNVGFTAGLTYHLGCAAHKGEMTSQQAAKTMLRLMKKQGVPTTYAGRTDVSDLAKTMVKAKGC